MKKLLLSVLTITVFGFAAKAQIVNIPDANFKTYLVGNASINTNGDTEIQVSEASAFTGQISCSYLSITDLTGIEAFTSLTQLACHGNSLTTLDVTQNTALTLLYCFDNTISSLDVTQNTALTDLWCYENTISSLDVTQNTALTRLKCYTNSLTSLDVTQNAALTQLYCQDNSLSSLDVMQNTALTKLHCYDNSISSLDVTQNTALTELYCLRNSLTSLNVTNGNNSNFTAFNATDNPNLTCIQVDNVAYSTTNWTNIDATASFSLNCSACIVNIPDANFKAYLVGNTAINTNGDTEIQCSEASAFTGAIACNNLSISSLTGIEAFTALTILSCAGNTLSTLDISSNTDLIELACPNNLLSTLNVSSNTSLTTLNCMNNLLTSLDVSSNIAIVYVVCNNNFLSSLNVANGNNSNFTRFWATNNPNLTCIQVDNVTWSTANWTVINSNIDATASFSLNCSGSVGVNEQVSQNSLTVYPNPATNQLTIGHEDLKILSISVLNITGKTVKTISNTNNTVDVSDLVKGIYFVQVQAEEGMLSSKFIKE